MPNQMWKLFLSRVEFHFHVDVCWVVTSSGLCLNYKHILHYSLDFIVHTVPIILCVLYTNLLSGLYGGISQSFYGHRLLFKLFSVLSSNLRGNVLSAALA